MWVSNAKKVNDTRIKTFAEENVHFGHNIGDIILHLWNIIKNSKDNVAQRGIYYRLVSKYCWRTVQCIE